MTTSSTSSSQVTKCVVLQVSLNAKLQGREDCVSKAVNSLTIALQIRHFRAALAILVC